jgi:hypothetical protein
VPSRTPFLGVYQYDVLRPERHYDVTSVGFLFFWAVAIEHVGNSQARTAHPEHGHLNVISAELVGDPVWCVHSTLWSGVIETEHENQVSGSEA